MKHCFFFLFLCSGAFGWAETSLRPDLIVHAKTLLGREDVLPFLCERTRDGGAEQWLVLLDEPKTTSGSSGSGLGIAGVFMKTLYTSTRHKYRFDDVPVAIRVRFIGPFRAGTPKVESEETSLKLNSVYLESGLYGAATLFHAMQLEGRKDPQISFFLSDKFSDAQVERDTKRAQAEKFTAEDERIYAKSIFALIQFGAVGFKTRGLDEVLQGMVEKPGMLSGAFTQLNWSGLKRSETEGTPKFVVPFAFQTKTAIKGLITIEKPDGRIRRCGGITGIEIQESTKSPGSRLTLRLIHDQELAATKL